MKTEIESLPPSEPVPQLKGRRFAIICCWILGLGTLLPWNSMLTIADYYYQVFPNYHPSRILSLMYQPCAIGSIIYLTWNESKINTRKRNITGFCIFSMSCFLLIVLDLVSHGNGSIVCYIILCMLSGSFGAADALVNGGTIGDLSFMEPIFLQSLYGGMAASGALTSALRLMTKAVFDKFDHGLRYGALLFLGISTVLEFICMLVYTFVFPRIPIIKYYRTKASAEGSKTVTADLAAVGIHPQDEGKNVERLSTKELILQNWDYALDLYLIYVLTLSIIPGFLFENTGTHRLGSWYPLVLIALYNVWDLVARYTPLIKWLRIKSRKGLLAACVARALFVPAFYFTAKYGDQGWMLMLVSLLGLTNGHLMVCVMMDSPQGYKGPEQNALGNALVGFLLAGIFTGAALDWLWIIGHGSF